MSLFLITCFPAITYPRLQDLSFILEGMFIGCNAGMREITGEL